MPSTPGFFPRPGNCFPNLPPAYSGDDLIPRIKNRISIPRIFPGENLSRFFHFGLEIAHRLPDYESFDHRARKDLIAIPPKLSGAPEEIRGVLGPFKERGDLALGERAL
jgi:hypothetical protein